MERLTFTPDDVQRFMGYVEKLWCGCWYWTGARSRGKGNVKWYGSFWLPDHGSIRAHRFSCGAIGLKGPLPVGHHRDHLCNFSMCVNPDHFEYVTHRENELRKQHRIVLRVDAVTLPVVT